MGIESKLYIRDHEDHTRLMEVTTMYSRVLNGKIVYDIYVKGSNVVYATFEADVLVRRLEAV